MISIHGKWSTFTWFDVFIYDVYFLSLEFRCAMSDCSSWCSHLVCLCLCVFFFSVVVCCFSLYNYNSPTAWHYRISCYFIVNAVYISVVLIFFSSFPFSLFLLLLLLCFCFALASNISYLIILMCLIVCLKVFHPLSTGAGVRAYIQHTTQIRTYHLKVIVRFTSFFFSELERLFLKMLRRKFIHFCFGVFCWINDATYIDGTKRANLRARVHVFTVETDLSSTIIGTNHLLLVGSTTRVKYLTPDFKSCSFIYGIASDNCVFSSWDASTHSCASCCFVLYQLNVI